MITGICLSLIIIFTLAVKMDLTKIQLTNKNVWYR